MSFLPTIAEVQSIAQNDAFIQATTDSDTVWTIVTEYVNKKVTEAIYGEIEKEAQIYLTAHMLSLANQPVGGRGPLSSESIGGISQSFTLPYLNQLSVIGSTQFGLMYLFIRKSVVGGPRAITV